MLQGALLTRLQSPAALSPSVTSTLFVFVSSGGTGIFGHLMTTKVILYGHHCDCCSGMRVVGMMPETLQIGATKSNMDGPRLWSQGSARADVVLMTVFCRRYTVGARVLQLRRRQK